MCSLYINCVTEEHFRTEGEIPLKGRSKNDPQGSNKPWCDGDEGKKEGIVYKKFMSESILYFTFRFLYIRES